MWRRPERCDRCERSFKEDEHEKEMESGDVVTLLRVLQCGRCTILYDASAAWPMRRSRSQEVGSRFGFSASTVVWQ